MNTFFSFIGEIFRKSILAFFITVSATTALCMPLLFLITLSVAAVGTDIESDKLTTSYEYGDENSENKILAVPITGVIYGDLDMGGGSTDIFGNSYDTFGYEVKDVLHKAERDNSIKAVVLLINSPGGTIVGSAAIADGIAQYKAATKRPVYAHVSGMAASGAYWAAVGADKIHADSGSIIGSVGVINGGFMFYNNPVALDGGLLGEGVTTKDGIESYYITSGKGKDLGNPFRRPTDEELKVLQDGADNNYATFVNRVSQLRGIPEETIRNNLGAYIYDNESAIGRKMLDVTSSREETFATLAKAANIGNDFQVVSGHERKSRLEMLLGAVSSLRAPQASTVEKRLKAEFCAPHKPLVYYGDVAKVCSQ
jgi:protease-4